MDQGNDDNGMSNQEYMDLKNRSEKSLQAVKKARKQIEADAQLLANRIALLKWK